MTTLSGSPLTYVRGFDDYISGAAAHDQTRPGGPSVRVEHQSCLGDCRPESFVGDMLRTRLAYGKADLEIDAYSYVLSHSHEELDPNDDSLGAVAHGLAREWAKEAWPGRQVKIVTQRDNGRWEEDPAGERVWIDGKWHSHVVVANVAEQAVELRWSDADGIEKTKHYKPGRAVDGDLKNIFRLRHITDDVVLREWKYDNKQYVEDCRRFAAGAATKQDLAQRAERGYSSYDEVRLKLRTAAAQATSWDDYMARCQAGAVDVRVRGKSGVSYSWVDDAGLERKARARGKDGIGPEFTRGEVEKRCEVNAAALARGEQLEVPEQVLVVPTSTLSPDRPRPTYLTADGKPPWESDQELTEYAQRVRATGGTYEGRVAQALLSGDAAAQGVELPRGAAGTTATVDAGYGPVAVDLQDGIAARAAEVAGDEVLLEEMIAQHNDEYVAATAEVEAALRRAQAREAEAEAALAAAEASRLKRHILEAEAAEKRAKLDHRGLGLDDRESRIEAAEAAVVKARRTAEKEGRTEGYAAGYTQGEEDGRNSLKQTQDAAAEELERARKIREKAEAEAETKLAEAAKKRDAAASTLEGVENQLREAAQANDEMQRRLAAMPEFDLKSARDGMTARLVDEINKMKVPDVDPATGEVIRTEDGKAVGRPVLEVAGKLAAHKDQRLRREASDETFGERVKRIRAATGSAPAAPAASAAPKDPKGPAAPDDGGLG